ncbi:MAG: hypothetical protein Q7R76_00360 [Candidatus Woesearchaeota archaeon]|nr:hypothetical protein [Candidatus Woesearchaeota archaeon]
MDHKPVLESMVLAHQVAHLNAILKGELHPLPLPKPESLGTKTREFVSTMRSADFIPYAVRLAHQTDPNLFILLLPDKKQYPEDPTIEHAVGLFAQMYERGMPFFDFYLATLETTEDASIVRFEQAQELRKFITQFRRVRVSPPQRVADHHLRGAESTAIAARDQHAYLNAQIERFNLYKDAIRKNVGSGPGIAMIQLRDGCNPALFDIFDNAGLTYIAVAPSYANAQPSMMTLTTVVGGIDWLFADQHIGRIHTLLGLRGITDIPHETVHNGLEESGYRLNKRERTYTLPDGHGQLKVEILHMDGDGNRERRKSMLTVSVPRACNDLVEALGKYVHGI